MLQAPIELSALGMSETVGGQLHVSPRNDGLEAPNTGRFVMKEVSTGSPLLLT